MKILAFIAGIFLASAPAMAETVSLKSEVLVEKILEVDGEQQIVRVAPETVIPGDKLVFVISYENESGQPVTGFELNNPLPSAVTYVGQEGRPALVSVNNGETFGELAELTVAEADGTERPATNADVTNLRWKFDRPIAANESGNLSFIAFVK